MNLQKRRFDKSWLISIDLFLGAPRSDWSTRQVVQCRCWKMLSHTVYIAPELPGLYPVALLCQVVPGIQLMLSMHIDLLHCLLAPTLLHCAILFFYFCLGSMIYNAVNNFRLNKISNVLSAMKYQSPSRFPSFWLIVLANGNADFWSWG